MTTPVSNIPVAVDYTSRDYYSLREDLVEIVKARVNQSSQSQWSGDDPSDFGIALIEAFAYMGDILNYYIDRVANEGYLPTATRRESIINLAALYGYTPSGYTAANTVLTFTNSSSEAIVIPAGTQVSGEVVKDDLSFEVIFTTTEDATIPAATNGASGYVEVQAKHGEAISTRDENLANGPFDIAGELLGVSDGAANQTYQLYENQVVDGSIVVYVQNGDIFEPWTQVIHLSDFGPTEAVYSVTIDADNFVYINFGDGVSGAIPNVGAVIKAQYNVGGGVIGNISAKVINDVLMVPGIGSEELNQIMAYVAVSNEVVGSGGTDPETNESIRINAPKLLTALNRAVTLADYKNLALAVNEVGKANATAESAKSVVLYVAPKRSFGTAEEFPGFNTANTTVQPDLTAIISDVAGFMEDKIQIGVGLKVFPPTYVPVQATISYTKLPQYTEAQIKSAIKSKVLTEFSYDYQDFGAVISPKDIEYQLMQIPGVKIVKVSGLLRASGTQSGTTNLIGAPDEIFVFQDSGLTITEISADATLESLSSSSGTLSPAFDADFPAYNLVGASTNSVVLTFATTQETATVLVNGVTATGTATISTPSGATTVATIAVTAPDESTVKVYTVTIVR